MKGKWRQQLLATNRRSSDMLGQTLSEDKYEYLSELRLALKDQLAHFDPSFSFPEEFLVRIVELPDQKSSVTGLKPEWQGIVKGVSELLQTAGLNRGQVRLSNISEGSTVLHFCPSEPAVPVEVLGESTGSIDSQFIRAANKVLRNVQSVQGNSVGSVRIVAALRKIERQVEGEVEEIEFVTRAPSGRLRSTTLTQSGMSFLRTMERTHEVAQEETITGRVVLMKEPGIAKVKTAPARNSFAPEIDVGAERLRQLGVELGASVSWTISRVKLLDQLDELISERFEYLSQNSEAPEGLFER